MTVTSKNTIKWVSVLAILMLIFPENYFMKRISLLLCCILTIINHGFAQNVCAENMGSLPAIRFSVGSSRLNDEAKEALAMVASKLRSNTGCKLVVTGYCDAGEAPIQLSWDHVNTVINKYLINIEGLSPDRFIFRFAQKGDDCDKVDLRAANPGEDGASMAEAPYPDLRKS